MNLTVTIGDVTRFDGDALLLAMPEGNRSAAARAVDDALGGELTALIERGTLKRGARKATLIPTLGRLPVRLVVAVGLGDPDALSLATLRDSLGEGCRRLLDQPVERLAVAAVDGLEPQQAAEASVEAVLLSWYRFLRYKHDDAPPAAPGELCLLAPDEALRQVLERGLEVGAARAGGTNFARDLVNTPPLDMTPTDLVAAARQMADEVGLECEVLDDGALEAMGCNLILAVNRGSHQPAAMIVLRHRGGSGTPIGLVGKGVCFDSGGLSIKTSEGMMTMKGDMAGAAAVLGAMRAIALLKLPLNVTAVIPTVQNLVSDRSIRPSDVVTGYAGKSVEVLNTDAEGRLILADALAYAVKDLGCSPIVDIATLTGACMRALGPVYAGGFSDDEELIDLVCQVGRQAGEKIWPLPLDDAFGELMKSSIADLKNISGQSDGGASTAAMFLKAFVGDTPWVHLDIAGRAITSSEKPCQPLGATGFGARTLLNFCISRAKQGS